MRIVGGEYKGRRITAPRGHDTRPTSDRNRESLFNILTARDDFQFENQRVIDLFAGSGALGLEAISRGASFALFVENNASARGAIRENIETLGLFGHTRIHRRSATQLGNKPSTIGDPFSLAFLDPPYGKNLVEPTIETLVTGGWLDPGAFIVIEKSKNEPETLENKLSEIDQRIFGDTKICFYRYKE